ncbi:MAG: hypothetical protein J6O41_00410 [Clostridia bacterium]|nr:hypothetical protein [Clostridia bacterium]
MLYSEQSIRNDLLNISVKDFYMKYLLRADNWYFENILCIDAQNVIHAVDDFKMLVSEAMNIGYNNVVMVGSAKIGYSLSPNKFLKHFTDEGEEKSDIDIAIVSPYLFDFYWNMFRKSYDATKETLYQYISRAIYRGYISDRDMFNIEECRKEWVKLSSAATRQLQSKMYFKHDIHYRIYRDWKDMEEYHIQTIEKLKRRNENGK